MFTTMLEGHHNYYSCHLSRDAGEVMARLVQDNAWYRNENELLTVRLAQFDTQTVKVKQQLAEMLKEKRMEDEERRLLQRHLESLREAKADLEYQSRHLGLVYEDIVVNGS